MSPHDPTTDPDPATNRDILTILPRPINYQYIHRTVNGRPETTIARTWRLQDAARCPLCADCNASPAENVATALCLRVVAGHVPESQVELFRDAASFARRVESDRRPGTSTG